MKFFCLDSPQGEIIQNQFSMPLPRISNREVVAMKVWVPETLTTDRKSGMYRSTLLLPCVTITCVYVCVCVGFVMISVDHPNAHPTEKVRK